MRGRKPKPTQQQMNEGDPRKKGKGKLQQKLAAEPIAARGLPDCPAHLRGMAAARWAFWKEELEKMRLDSRPDDAMLEGACRHYARAVEADLVIEVSGITVEEPVINREGELVGHKIKNHPAIATSNAAWKQVRMFCSEFGLSPVSRTRLTVEKADDGSADLMAQLSQPRRKSMSAVN